MAARRRWLRFRLRTLFVAVTIIALWLGWNVWTIKQRRGMAESLRRTRRGYSSEYAADGTGQFRGPGGSTVFTWADGKPSVTISSLQFMFGESHVFSPRASDISLIRRWLGDDRYASIVLYDDAGVEDVRRHFPEAIVLTLPTEETASTRRATPSVSRKTKPEHSVLRRGKSERPKAAILSP
jgi:hypothetical protein